MTSRKSLAKPFSRTFWHTVKSCLYVPAIVASVLTVGVAYLNVYLRSTNILGYYSDEDAITVARDVKFVLLGYGYGNEELTAIALHVALAAVAAMLAVMIFRFLNSKKTVNVWYSLGISKTSLFWSKLLGGVFLLGTMILLPAVLDLAVNIRLFGFSYELFMSWLYVMSGFMAYTLNVFLLLTAVMCFVGTSVEGVIFGGILLVTPTLLFAETATLMNTLTLGSEYNYNTQYIFTDTNRFNPLLILNDINSYSSLTKSGETATFVWSMPPFHVVALWLCVAVLLAVLAGVLFKRRKTEIAGFWGSSKAMTFVISLDACLAAFCVGVYAVKSDRINAILLGLAAAAVAFLVADILLTFNKREWVKNLKMLPVQAVLLAVVGTVFATGLFGYSTRIPELDTVKGITITPVAYSGIIKSVGGYSYIDDAVAIPSYSYDSWYYNLPLTSDGDKRTVEKIHRQFIEADLIHSEIVGSEAPRSEQIFYSPVTIEYTKYDGSTLKRCYNYVPMSIYSTYKALNFGDWYKQMVKKYMAEPVLKTDSEDVVYNKAFYQSDNNAIYLVSKHLDQSYTMLTLTSEQRKQLLTAVANDLVNTEVDVKQKPLTEQLGTLVFTADSIKDINALKNGEKLIDIGKVTGDSYYDYAYTYSTYFPVLEKGSVIKRYFSEGTTVSVMLTAQMTETMAFLEKNGLTGLLDFDVAVKSVRVLSREALTRVQPKIEYYYYDQYAQNPPGVQFNGMYSDTSPATFDACKKITDKTLIEKLSTVSYNAYYTDEEVYYVCYELSGGGYSVMCIPAKLMPAELTK